MFGGGGCMKVSSERYLGLGERRRGLEIAEEIWHGEF